MVYIALSLACDLNGLDVLKHSFKYVASIVISVKAMFVGPNSIKHIASFKGSLLHLQHLRWTSAPVILSQLTWNYNDTWFGGLRTWCAGLENPPSDQMAHSPWWLKWKVVVKQGKSYFFWGPYFSVLRGSWELSWCQSDVTIRTGENFGLFL